MKSDGSCFAQIRAVAEQFTSTGKKGRVGKRTGHPPVKLTDDQVIECRIQHEQHGVKVHILASRAGTSVEYMRSLINYQVRSKLFPPITTDSRRQSPTKRS